ncbi:hypothetical protein ASC80_01015 [Afipia sp. Root123D2]|uniref:hypothetical protein n=1 Tax=Afipia sp. Root123D2 TaxID=1736436 RepID=UPI0006FC1101|nr:hypothetical protein [Afipia sp. Root123D2]KQW22013.1 hypothetical protein ASC80_01015 [Afipia sp. Root123D2]
MTIVDTYSTSRATIGSWLARLVVLVMLMGQLASLIQCAGCELHVTSTDVPAMTLSHNQNSSTDIPEQLPPCHSGHCLCHVTTQTASTVVLPADTLPRAHALRQEPILVSFAGLPLFKPPRA